MRSRELATALHTTGAHDLADGPMIPHDADIVTAILLAGEELAAPMRTVERPLRRASHASSSASPVYDDDFEWMLDIVRHAAARLAEEPARGRLASELSDALGDGEPLALLFNRFFPRGRAAMHLAPDGRPLLTRRQVEILREASLGLSNAEIAERLYLSPRTVTTHLDKIHRRLGVSRTVQAIAKAVALGYLDLDAVGFVTGAARTGLRGYSVLSALLAQAGTEAGIPGAASWRRLAQFGLLLTVASVAAAMTLRCDDVDDVPLVGVVACVSQSGEILRAFGSDRLRAARALCRADQAASRYGFVPGHLYVVNDRLPQMGLNTAEIVAYTPSGEEAGAFCGARDVATRLTECRTLAFTARGSLLASSGSLTEGILMFSDGGGRVERYADVRASQIACSPRGAVCVAATGPRGSRVIVYDADGAVVDEMEPLGEGTTYGGIGILPEGAIVTSREERGDAVIEILGADGHPIRRRVLQGVGSAQIHVDRAGKVFVPCASAGCIEVFNRELERVRRIRLHGISPAAVTTDASGGLWVCGQVE